jgi:hypothetical protein
MVWSCTAIMRHGYALSSLLGTCLLPDFHKGIALLASSLPWAGPIPRLAPPFFPTPHSLAAVAAVSNGAQYQQVTQAGEQQPGVQQAGGGLLQQGTARHSTAWWRQALRSMQLSCSTAGKC